MVQAKIRLAAPTDLPRLIELLAQLSIDGPREQMDAEARDAYVRAFDEIASDPRQELLGLELDGQLVGSLTLIIVPNLTHGGRPYALVENVVVDEQARGHGHGETLMRHAIDKAQSAGCYKLALTSNKQRPDAHRFYKRLGLHATSEGFRINFD